MGEIDDWIKSKLEQRSGDLQETGVQTTPAARDSRFERELPAVATLRGETFVDHDELRERSIPPEYQFDGANAVYRTGGDSMIDAGILDGDILFVRQTRNRTAANGRVVVGRLDGTFTVKRLR